MVIITRPTRKRRLTSDGTEMARIYANLPDSFTFDKWRLALKMLELFRLDFLAWKAAGQPTET
jgi:hypothetical protein